MTRMVKVIYEERSTRMQGEKSNIPKGDKPSKGEEGYGDKPRKGNGNCVKPPLTPPFSSPPSSPPSSPSSSSTTNPSQTPPQTPKHHGKALFFKPAITFYLPIYNGEVNVDRLESWVRQLEVSCRI